MFQDINLETEEVVQREKASVVIAWQEWQALLHF